MDTVVRDPYREALEAATGLSPRELFSRRDPSAYPALERGEIDETAYWATYADAGLRVDVEAFHATRRAGYAWLPGMRELVTDLAPHVRLVAASNYPSWVDEVATGILDEVFDTVLASCHLGARKPDIEFFTRLLDRLGAPAADVAFVDDREANVAGAREAGLRATRFEDASSLRDWLRGLGLPLRRQPRRV